MASWFNCGRGVEVGFGVVRLAGSLCGVGMGEVSGLFSSVGVAAVPGVAEGCGEFSPGAKLPDGFAVGLLAGWFSFTSGRAGVADGPGAFRFGGVSLGTLAGPSGGLPLGDRF